MFFAGLFVVVGGLVTTGVIDTIAHAATAVEGKLWPATLLLLWASASLSAIVDNIPYVATMSPIVKELVDASGGNDHAQVLWWALAIGADLGGNATAVGASGNVVVLGIADRAGRPRQQVGHRTLADTVEMTSAAASSITLANAGSSSHYDGSAIRST